jgi:hypothetical protein
LRQHRYRLHQDNHASDLEPVQVFQEKRIGLAKSIRLLID